MMHATRRQDLAIVSSLPPWPEDLPGPPTLLPAGYYWIDARSARQTNLAFEAVRWGWSPAIICQHPLEGSPVYYVADGVSQIARGNSLQQALYAHGLTENLPLRQSGMDAVGTLLSLLGLFVLFCAQCVFSLGSRVLGAGEHLRLRWLARTLLQAHQVSAHEPQ